MKYRRFLRIVLAFSLFLAACSGSTVVGGPSATPSTGASSTTSAEIFAPDATVPTGDPTRVDDKDKAGSAPVAEVGEGAEVVEVAEASDIESDDAAAAQLDQVADKIYFSADVDGGRALFRMDSDGSAVEQLTDVIEMSSINVSPDGSRAAIGERVAADGAPFGELDIAVVDFTDGTKIQITERAGNELDPEWSPNGDWLLYRQVEGDDAGLHLVPGTGGSSTLAIREADLSSLWSEKAHSWGPTTETIIYRSASEELTVAGDEAHQLAATQLASEIAVHEGKMIAFEVDAPERSRFFDSDLRVVSTDGASEILISELPGLKHDFSWSPDGNWIAFLNDDDAATGGESSLHITSADGTITRELIAFESGRYLSLPVWSPTSDALIVSAGSGEGELMILDLEGGPETLEMSGRPVAWR